MKLELTDDLLLGPKLISGNTEIQLAIFRMMQQIYNHSSCVWGTRETKMCNRGRISYTKNKILYQYISDYICADITYLWWADICRWYQLINISVRLQNLTGNMIVKSEMCECPWMHRPLWWRNAVMDRLSAGSIQQVYYFILFFINFVARGPKQIKLAAYTLKIR